jgi:hypothetical protein
MWLSTIPHPAWQDLGRQSMLRSPGSIFDPATKQKSGHTSKTQGFEVSGQTPQKKTRGYFPVILLKHNPQFLLKPGIHFPPAPQGRSQHLGSGTLQVHKNCRVTCDWPFWFLVKTCFIQLSLDLVPPVSFTPLVCSKLRPVSQDVYIKWRPSSR